ncbi:MAG: nuclear transport factor 2 family protein [Cyanobacteria bacterium P01_C01_bin.121]
MVSQSLSHLSAPLTFPSMKNPLEEHIKAQILEAEEALRLAMLHSDVTALNELLSPNLIFTNHRGQIFSKHRELSTHVSGEFEFTRLTFSEHHILPLTDNVVIVSVKAWMVGMYAERFTDNTFRFTRVWSLTPDGQWQVISGHSSLIDV